MQEKYLMISVELHQRPHGCNRLIYHLLEKGGAMADLENG